MKKIMQNQVAENYGFVDILQERRVSSDFLWASKKWKPKRTWGLTKNITPSQLRSIVRRNRSISHMVKELSLAVLMPKNVIYSIVAKILDEIGLSSNFLVVRTFAVFLSKTFKKLLTGILVNERKILEIKSLIGKNPVVLVPSHKSYCDFLIMAFICFHYEIEIPKVAAGSDFQEMAMLGKLLSKSGAFFMRRTFIEDKLYSKVFNVFVEQLIENTNSPIEFFIEGTRSRTSETLLPKLGFLKMVLKPYFLGKVPNITLIPVNLSYDRVLEELLFATELLGVPKPKESTMGLIKALSLLKERTYGNIYINFGNPISVKQYFKNRVDRSIHGFGPIDSQELSLDEKEQINNIAHSIVVQQRDLTVLNIFNLIALILNDNLVTSHEPLNVNELLTRVLWIFSVLKMLVPETVVFAITDISKEDILYQLKLHESLMHLKVNGEQVQFGKVYTRSSEINTTKAKARILSDNIIEVAVPLIMLQNYLNPCSYFLIKVCFVSLVIQSFSTEAFISKGEMFDQFQFLCTVFYYKFVHHKAHIEKYFEEAIIHSQRLKIIEVENNKIKRGGNNKLHDFFYNFCFSFIPGYLMVTEILVDLSREVLSDNLILECYQERIQSEFKDKSAIHPANLCLLTFKNALQAFTSMEAVQILMEGSEKKYQVDEGKMKNIQAKLKCLYPAREINLNFLQHFSTFTTSNL